MSRSSTSTAPVFGGRGAPDGNRGGTGAPPSNTAPDNSTVFFQPLRWGIDSLYLSFPGSLHASVDSDLASLKKQAQSVDYEAAAAQYPLGDHIFEVRDKGSGLFKYALADGHFDIKLSSGKSGHVPMAYVQVRSGYLAFKAPGPIAIELFDLLSQLGDINVPKVSRADLFVDFASTVDMEAWPRDAWVTRASAVHQYAEDATFTGWMIGAGGPVVARLYLKSLECKKTRKTYLFDLWQEAGWDGDTPVWRLELEFRRESLAQLSVDSMYGLLNNLNGMWSYGLTEWLKLCEPNPNDKTRSRWSVHPLWAAIASVDWETSGGPLRRAFPASRAPSREYLGRRGLGLAASIAAISGLADLGAACDELQDAIHQALGDRYCVAGISDEQGFHEMVAVNNRKYNVALNGSPDAPGAEQPLLQNPYYRAQQGM